MAAAIPAFTGVESRQDAASAFLATQPTPAMTPFKLATPLALTLAQWYILMPSYARDTAPSTFWRGLPFWLLEAALAWAACMATPHIQRRIKNW